MAQSLAQLGIRTLWQVMFGSPPAYTTIPEARVVSGFGLDKPEQEVTHFESPDDAVERIPGLKDGRVFTISGNLTDDNREMIEELAEGTSAVEWKQIIPLPLNQTRYFSAACTGYTEGDYTPGTPIPYQMTWRINRPPSAVAP